MDHNKIEAKKEWPHPTSLKSTYNFYSWQFIYNYGKFVVPLTALLKKDAFSCNASIHHAFQELKDVVCLKPTLALPKFTKTFGWNVIPQEKKLMPFSCEDILLTNKIHEMWGSL